MTNILSQETTLRFRRQASHAFVGAKDNHSKSHKANVETAWNLKCRQQTENALQRCVRTRLASAQLKYLVGSCTLQI